MNDRKRARLKAILILLKELRDEEAQDLKDTPDNIEQTITFSVITTCFLFMGQSLMLAGRLAYE